MSCDKQKCEQHGIRIPEDCIEYECADYESSHFTGLLVVGQAWALQECDQEGCVVHSLYASKRACLRQSLALKRKRVVEALDYRLLFGKKPWPDYYRIIWEDVVVSAVEHDILADH